MPIQSFPPLLIMMAKKDRVKRESSIQRQKRKQIIINFQLDSKGIKNQMVDFSFFLTKNKKTK